MTPSKPCEQSLRRGLWAPSLFPLLEPPETKPEPPLNLPGGEFGEHLTLAETFRHSGWQRDRTRVYHALHRTMQSVTRLMAFGDCGAFSYVFQSVKAPYEYRLGGSSCRDRFCVPCAKDRSRVLATNVLKALANEPARFLTLTLKVNDGPLTAQIDRLYSCFAALRTRAFWRKRVNGGCAFTEVKWSKRSEGWNVHVHCLIRGLYLPKSDVWRAWYAITGDSMIVDIKLVQHEQAIARYITKYVSKPIDNSFLNRQPQFDELIKAMHGRRLCITFGDWRGIKLTESPEPGDWINLGSFEDVVALALMDDPDSLKAIRQICTDRTPEILAAFQLARPPPAAPAPSQRQLYFQTFASCLTP